MFRHDGLEREAVAERPGDVEVVARLQHRHAAGAAPLGLVEELDLAVRLVDAIDAHRPAHPHLGAVGRRAQQVEHLPGVGLQRVRVHLEDDVLVLVVDPFVGDDRADELADQPLRIGVDVADAQRGIGVVVVRVEGHRSMVSDGWLLASFRARRKREPESISRRLWSCIPDSPLRGDPE